MSKKVGIALGSGADRGFAHIGVLKVLEKNKIDISCISGSSMGALVGAHYALYKDVARLEKLALDFTHAELMKLVDLNNPMISVIKGQNIRKYLTEKIFGDSNFSDTKIPLAIVATVLENGSAYEFRCGKIVDAVLASSTIPGIFPPVEVNGFHLIDGGIAAAVPIDVLDKMGADVRIGVDLYSYTPVTQSRFTAVDVIYRAYRLYLSKLSAAASTKDDGRTVIIRPKTDRGIETLTFSHAKSTIKAGEDVTLKAVGEIKKLL